MEGLAVCAELLLETADFRGGNAECIRRLLLLEFQQLHRGGRCTERAYRACRMPASRVMIAAIDERFAELPLDFRAEHVRGQDVFAARAELLRKREDRGDDHDGAMADENL